MDTEVQVSDIHIAAYLTVRGFEVRRVVGPRARREFVFAPEAAEAIPGFFSGSGDQVSARALVGALRHLKGLLADGGSR